MKYLLAALTPTAFGDAFGRTSYRARLLAVCVRFVKDLPLWAAYVTSVLVIVTDRRDVPSDFGVPSNHIWS